MLGKTRQSPEPPTRGEDKIDSGAAQARGVLRRPASEGNFRHARRMPSASLAHLVSHYWMVFWEVGPVAPQVETLPHPNFHLVFEAGNATVSGVYTGRFTRLLEGNSHVFGVKFRPGGFRPYLGRPAISLANETAPAEEFFGEAICALARSLNASSDEDEMADAVSAFLGARVPAPDVNVGLADDIVARILAEPEIRTVDDLAVRSGFGKRSLQRLFSDYVGASPKWVIRRYRLHELLERAHAGQQLDWPQLALELGYFDQSHLINDFRAMVGCTPGEYQAQAPAR